MRRYGGSTCDGQREWVSWKVWQPGRFKWSIIGFVAAVCLGVALMLTVGIIRKLVPLPETQMPDNIEPFTITFANACERLHTEMNKTIASVAGTAPIVISFDVVSDDGVFEEKQEGFDDSITGASKECGSAALSSHKQHRDVRQQHPEREDYRGDTVSRHGWRLHELLRWRHLTSGFSTQPLIIVHVILR